MRGVMHSPSMERANSRIKYLGLALSARAVINSLLAIAEGKADKLTPTALNEAEKILSCPQWNSSPQNGDIIGWITGFLVEPGVEVMKILDEVFDCQSRAEILATLKNETVSKEAAALAVTAIFEVEDRALYHYNNLSRTTTNPLFKSIASSDTAQRIRDSIVGGASLDGPRQRRAEVPSLSDDFSAQEAAEVAQRFFPGI